MEITTGQLVGRGHGDHIADSGQEGKRLQVQTFAVTNYTKHGVFGTVGAVHLQAGLANSLLQGVDLRFSCLGLTNNDHMLAPQMKTAHRSSWWAALCFLGCCEERKEVPLRGSDRVSHGNS